MVVPKPLRYRFDLRWGYLALALILTAFRSDISDSTEAVIWFDILHRDKPIGYIQLAHIQAQGFEEYQIQSEVNTRVIFKFKAIGKERVTFRNDTLLQSDMYRAMNNKIRVDQSLIYRNGYYELANSKGRRLLDTDVIQFNLTQLMITEPTKVDTVFCDRELNFAKIERIDDHVYRVKLAPGKYNTYYYRDGVCTSIEAVGTFYRVILRRNESKSTSGIDNSETR